MKVRFVYSDIYDVYLHYCAGKNWHDGQNIRSGEAFAKKMQELYDKNRRALDLLPKVSGLRWKEPEVKVYVVHKLDWDYSDPVTLLIRKDMKDAFETFLHEMAHQLCEVQNKGTINWDNAIAKRYRHENATVQRHILQQAILTKAYLKFYGKKRTQEIIDEYEKEGWNRHYRAWQIVAKEGADKIIRAYVG